MRSFLAKRKLNLICSAAAILLVLLIWLIAYYAVGDDYVVPSFTETMVSLWACLGEGEFWTAFAFTLLRTAEAFIISFVLAAVCASVSAFSKVFCELLKPFMAILRAVPTLAVILLLLIWTTPGVAPVIVTILVLFPMLYAQFSAALGEADGELAEMAKVYGISKKERLFKIYIPQIAPNILAQSGAAFSLGLKLTVSAEVLSNTFKSLGGLMQTARNFLQIPRLAALTLVAVFAGLIIAVALSALVGVTFKWRKRVGE